MASLTEPRLAVLYRWRVAQEHEAEFRSLWCSMISKFARERAAVGARLHRARGGLLVGYVEWPSLEVWQLSLDAGSPDADASARMRALAAEWFEPEPLEMLEDLLTHASC